MVPNIKKFYLIDALPINFTLFISSAAFLLHFFYFSCTARAAHGSVRAAIGEEYLYVYTYILYMHILYIHICFKQYISVDQNHGSALLHTSYIHLEIIIISLLICT